MELENFGHEHPVVLLNELDQQRSNQRKEVNYWCAMCGEKVSPSAPSYGCAEKKCEFYVHKYYGEAPSWIKLPFHPNHPFDFMLMLNAYNDDICDFCKKICKVSFYHYGYSDLNLHIKCALFFEKNLEELRQQVSLLEPQFISSENDDGQQHEHLSEYCFGCREPLANFTYFSLGFGFLHKKCIELPLKINHGWHRKHPLVLQLNSKGFSCQICEEIQPCGLVYCYPSCEFVVDIRCISASPLPIIENEMHHQHPFTLFRRQFPFTCDACGTGGNHGAYICTVCDIMVHTRCNSLPRVIKSYCHDRHPIFHKYFLQGDDFNSWDCDICNTRVDWEHGSYSCLDCKIMFYVNCVKEYPYDIINEGEEFIDDIIESFTCVKKNDAGDAIEIKHIEHNHNLMLSNKILEDDKCCDGCFLPILAPFYYCSICDFSLHKTCAEFPKKKQFWFHECKQLFVLKNYSGYIFRCQICWKYSTNGFAYKCADCKIKACLRCAIGVSFGARTYSGHKHPLFFYKDDKERQCVACHDTSEVPFRCKVCENFALCQECFSLPIRARNKFDKHTLILTDRDNNDCSESPYCDICEEKRDPNKWFYHCATCDNSAHPDCVIGNYPFIKPRIIWQGKDNHEHPLTVVKKIYYYPKCNFCDKLCQDLALECVKSDCSFIIHWACGSY